MLDFLKDLFVGEAQASAYVWAAVLLAHAMIGVALQGTLGGLAGRLFGDPWAGPITVAALYASWEIVQDQSGAPPADALLDWSAVTLGAVIALSLWLRHGARITQAVLALVFVCLAGVGARTRRRP